MNYIDLRSDTVTQPTQKMRDEIYKASVGDDVYNDDITMKELESYASQICGKEAALFVPSGTFGNVLAILTHTLRGNEVILADDSHIIQHEVGGAGVITGVQFRTLESNNGVLDPKRVKSKIRVVEDIHYPSTGLICLENAHSNGKVIPQEIMEATYKIAKLHNIPLHLDGARVFNAASYLGIEAKEIIKYTDTTMFCLSKGLAAPVGSMLVGSANFIDKARKNRKLMGGGLRQAGFLAAAGLVALKEMIPNLKIDHEKALYLGNLLQKVKGVNVYMNNIDINLVFFQITLDKDLSNFQKFMLDKQIKINDHEDGVYRVVTHHGIRNQDIDKFVDCLISYLK